MSRIASIFILSGWAGFSGFAALRCAHEAGFSEALIGAYGASLISGFNDAAIPVPPDQALGIAAILAALTIAFGLAIAGLMQHPEYVTRRGEPFAAAVLCAFFGFYGALALSASPAIGLVGEGPGVTMLVAMSFGALLFDHMVEDRGDGSDDEAFEAVMAHLEEAKRAAMADRRSRRDRDEGDS